MNPSSIRDVATYGNEAHNPAPLDVVHFGVIDDRVEVEVFIKWNDGGSADCDCGCGVVGSLLLLL